MIVRESITVKISGERFSPADAALRTRLPLVDKVEPGEIELRGSRKGCPLPYGYANLNASDEVPDDGKLGALLDLLLPHIETFRSLGADEIAVYAGYFWKDQCHLTF